MCPKLESRAASGRLRDGRELKSIISVEVKQVVGQPQPAVTALDDDSFGDLTYSLPRMFSEGLNSDVTHDSVTSAYCRVTNPNTHWWLEPDSESKSKH